MLRGAFWVTRAHCREWGRKARGLPEDPMRRFGLVVTERITRERRERTWAQPVVRLAFGPLH